jgi:hypothetical protein
MIADSTLLLAVVAAVWLLLFGASFVQEARLFRRLRDRHPDAWEELGRPSTFLRLRNRPAASFFKAEKHRQLDDRTIVRMVAIQRVLSWAHLVAFAGFFVLFFLTAR